MDKNIYLTLKRHSWVNELYLTSYAIWALPGHQQKGEAVITKYLNKKCRSLKYFLATYFVRAGNCTYLSVCTFRMSYRNIF